MKYPPHLKTEAISLYNRGLPVFAVAERLGVPYARAYLWTHPELEERQRQRSRRYKAALRNIRSSVYPANTTSEGTSAKD
jgi:hypothetical protein